MYIFVLFIRGCDIFSLLIPTTVLYSPFTYCSLVAIFSFSFRKFSPSVPCLVFFFHPYFATPVDHIKKISLLTVAHFPRLQFARLSNVEYSLDDVGAAAIKIHSSYQCCGSEIIIYLFFRIWIRLCP